MIVTTINNYGIHSVSLPQKPSGQYWLYGKSDDHFVRLVSIEGVNENWFLKSGRNVKVLDSEGNAAKNAELQPLNIYALVNSSALETIVFTEPITDDRQVFTKYMIKDNSDIVIGRSEHCDICYDNNFVSSHHATLFYKNGSWSLRDEHSTNGTFVNEKRIMQSKLSVGDCIFVMGLKIIVGRGFIAVNNPDEKVRISRILREFVLQQAAPVNYEDEYEAADPEYFYRSPRFKRDVEKAVFKIDSPPQSPVADEMPWPLVIGSSLAMGMMSFITIFNALSTGNTTSLAMGFSMIIGTLLIPVITKIYERNRKRKKEELRQTKYKQYLADTDAKIKEACRLQEIINNENNITVQECRERILGTKRNLWERTLGQNDFLKVRVGLGNGLLDADIVYQERKFSLDDDNLQNDLYALCEEPKILHNIPITYSLYDNLASGVIGERGKVADFAKGIIIQLAALYSYDEVKMVFLYDKSESDKFEFVKWLPHVWGDDYKFRFIATDTNEVKEVSAYLENIIAARNEINETEMENVTPYYIIFSMSKELAARAEMIKQVLSKKETIHMSVITFYDELKDLPKECSMVVELSENGGKMYDKDDVSGKSTEFTPDIYYPDDPVKLSVKLSNTVLNNAETGFKLPRTITFLEMFGVGKVEHLNALTRWKENDPTKSLQAAIGVDTLGELFKLDLHEKFHGPHGLIAGMTGSGKSEFIITYILSLAVNYHPDEVAFILIDYKGGGMAKSFEKLPHTAGIITNLDGAAIKRSLVSIESELKRRQAIFAATSKKVGVSNIDIYKYQKLYREGSVSEPLQHLFIISDEFAELKVQQPEFMTQLVSAARIGRSLGVHLILATQKPSGVVDDQIWSNSKFRVCMKVQERADSMDMLKRPDAAELTDTGRFYLQVGYNELFELGQSAWSGAPYYPSDKVQKEKDNSVVVVDMNGHPLKEAKIDHRRAKFANAKKQLDVITGYLSDIAKEEGIKIRPLWLEPLPAVIYLDDIRNRYSAKSEKFVLDPVIGEYDDPAHQRQCILRLPISTDGNAVVYGVAGSGKTSFLNAMIYSLIHEHTPDEVNLYILDFASETLRAFAKAPHVGDVILSYEAEKVSNLFKMLQAEAEKRKKRFADYGGDYASYIKMSGNTLPSIVVVINNFAAFTEMYDEKEEAVSFLSREGTKYGIYFVLTALGVGGVKFRLLQNFKQLLVLQLNDQADYSSVVGKTDGLYPSKFKGRGLVRHEDLYEFQVASLTEGEPPFRLIADECAALAEKWPGKTAKKVPVLPDAVNTEFLKDYVKQNNVLSVPVGVEKNTLNVHYYPFCDRYVNLIMSSGSEYQEFTANLAAFVGTQTGLNGVIFDLNKTVSADTGSIKTVSSVKECEAEIKKLFELVLYRNNTYKDAAEKGVECEKFENTVVFISSLSALRGALSGKSAEMLSLILEKGTPEYKVTVIAADQASAFSSVSFEKWYKTNVSVSDGIWIGGGITQQYQMKVNKTTSEMHDEINAEFGFSVIKGRPVKVKLLNEKTEDEEDDEQ